jgi:hypothetical protein
MSNLTVVYPQGQTSGLYVVLTCPWADNHLHGWHDRVAMSTEQLSKKRRATTDGSSFLRTVNRRMAQTVSGIQIVVSESEKLVIRKLYHKACCAPT